jgi:opacity protein-like surface antigen
MKHLFVLLIGLAIAPFAGAQPLTGGFVGFGVGSFSYQEDDVTGATIIDDTSSSWHALGGYEFNDHFAFEGSWGRSGSLHGTIDDFIPGSGPVTLELIGKYEIYTLRAVGMLPFKKFKLLGGLGYYNARLNLTVRAPGFGEFSDDSNTDDGAMAAIGAQYDLDRFYLRAEYDWFDAPSGVQQSEVSLNVLFKF